MTKSGVKGGTKPPGSGRKKGTPNKRTLVFRDLMDQVQFKPTEALIELLKTSAELKDRDKAFILLDLIQYEFPKRKAVELGDPNDPDRPRTFVIQWGDERPSADNASATDKDTGSKKNQ